MKLKWKQHELIFISIATAIIISGFIGAAGTGPEKAFIQNHVPFHLFRNVLGPEIGMSLIVYLIYLGINFYTIPRFLAARNLIKKLLSFFLQFLFIGLVLGTALNLSIYFQHEWAFHYPGFTIWFNPENSHSQLNLFASYAGGFLLLSLYFLYAFLRHLAIRYIDRPGERRLYQIMIANQITGFLTGLAIILLILNTIQSTDNTNIASWVLSFMLPGFVLFMTNTYWLFPSRGQNSLINFPLIARLLIFSIVLILPFSFLVGDHIFLWLLTWQLLTVTPVSWVLYKQRKERILTLRGLEKALVKSTADLQFLRSQINPHFLFNTLNTLYGTALREGAADTAAGVQKLGDMMRFMLHDNTRDFIPMNREIEYLKNYISFQKLRTPSSGGILIEDNLEEPNCPHEIAPMLLIPLIENAFKHGISLKEKSWIKIILECNEKEIRFEVRNSVHPRQGDDPEKERSGIGFKNVTERLKLIYPGKHEITVDQDNHEFIVKLIIKTSI
jgi:two-component system LytT family sensor kinase